MVGFTRELSCTDGSTDAYIFLPSVHPTLYKSVGPTCHNGWRLASSPNPIFSPAAARARLVTVRRRLLASGESLAYARLRPPPLRRPSALVVGRPHRPSLPSPRAQGATPELGFPPPANSRPGDTAATRRCVSKGAQVSSCPPPPFQC
jgi:hypothetical protein